MAQFGVHLDPATSSLLLDCQANILSHLNTRFVVPLLLIGQAPEPAKRLNPVFEIGGKSYVMVTQFAAAIAARELGPEVVSLADKHHEIMNALDILLTGV